MKSARFDGHPDHRSSNPRRAFRLASVGAERPLRSSAYLQFLLMFGCPGSPVADIPPRIHVKGGGCLWNL